MNFFFLPKAAAMINQLLERISKQINEIFCIWKRGTRYLADQTGSKICHARNCLSEGKEEVRSVAPRAEIRNGMSVIRANGQLVARGTWRTHGWH